jgi:hypothetical protein
VAVDAVVGAADGAGEEKVSADEQGRGVGGGGADGPDEVGVVGLGVAGGGEGFDGVGSALDAGAVGEAGCAGDGGAFGRENGDGAEETANLVEGAGVLGLGVGEKDGGETGDVGGPHAAEALRVGSGVEKHALTAATIGDEVGVCRAEAVRGAQGVKAERQAGDYGKRVAAGGELAEAGGGEGEGVGEAF